MKTVCIIPCGFKKIWEIKSEAGPTKAKDVYIGTFARKCQQYAEAFYPDSWFILSAKYGFLYPDDVVPGPYNVTFNDKKSNPINNEDLTIQLHKKGMNQYSKVIVLGGKNYVSRMIGVFGSKKIITPLEGCRGMGYMMGKLKNAIMNKRPMGGII